MKWIKPWLLIVACVVFTPAWAQQNESMQVYIARDESPRQVITHLLGLYGKELAGGQLPARPVSGRFEVKSVADVMAYFERAYKIGWFEYGSRVFVYRPSDWSTQRFYVGEYDASTSWDEMLEGAGLLKRKFNVFYSSPRDELMVTGPRDYLALVRKTFEVPRPVDKPALPAVEFDSNSDDGEQKSTANQAAPEPPPEPEFMVFPLKYASVEDRTIKLRDQEYTTPGVFSVLSGIIGAGGASTAAPPLSGGGGGIGSSDPYGLGGVSLSSLAHPATAVQAAGQLVEKSIRGVGPDRSEFFPGGIPKLSAGRDVNRQSIQSASPANYKYGKGGGVSSGSGSGSGGGSLFADARTNSVVVLDLPTRYDYYKKIIDQLDIPIAMIEVEAMLVEIDSNSLSELGVEFGLSKRGNISGVVGGALLEFPGEGALGDLAPLLGASSIVDPGVFVARLRALATDKNAKVLSRPTIVTQDNVPAFIDLSETLYLQVIGERTAQVEKVTAGSLLQVTPRLVKNNGSSEVFMSVEIQDGALSETDVGQNPTVRNTKLSTQALISRDKAILIGGYNREAQTEVEHRVPLLGSIPLLGRAFRSTEKSNQSFVRLFLITPKVLEQPTYFAESTRSAVMRLKESFNYDSSALSTPPSVNVLKLDSTLSLDPQEDN